MPFTEHFGLTPGITALIGGGGKTTFLRTVGEELAAQGKKVILTTTTHIFPFEGMPVVNGDSAFDVSRGFETSRVICCGRPEQGTGKLTAPRLSMEQLAELADYVITEADGSKGRPFKAHGPGEPVIPSGASRVICVIGWSGIGQRIREAAHRPELYAWLAGERPEAVLTPQIAAAVLNMENLGTVYFINQADTPKEVKEARELGRLLKKPVHIGSLRKGTVVCLS